MYPLLRLIRTCRNDEVHPVNRRPANGVVSGVVARRGPERVPRVDEVHTDSRRPASRPVCRVAATVVRRRVARRPGGASVYLMIFCYPAPSESKSIPWPHTQESGHTTARARTIAVYTLLSATKFGKMNVLQTLWGRISCAWPAVRQCVAIRSSSDSCRAHAACFFPPFRLSRWHLRLDEALIPLCCTAVRQC